MIKKILDGANIPPLAGIIQAVLFSVAGDIWFGRWYMGALAGLIPSLALAFGASRLAGISSKRRRYLGYGSLVIILALSPLVVSPALYLEMSETGLPDGLLWAVAIGWASLPDMSVVFAGVVAGQSLFSLAQAESKPKQVDDNAPQPKKKKTATKKQPITDKQLNDYWLRKPKATNVEVAQHFGVTPQAISKRKQNLYNVVDKERNP